MMKGRVDVYDLHLGEWSVKIDGGPALFGPVDATTGASGTTNTGATGVEWTFNTATGNRGGVLDPCGYVVLVQAWDRAIVNSGDSRHYRTTDIGFCVQS